MALDWDEVVVRGAESPFGLAASKVSRRQLLQRGAAALGGAAGAGLLDAPSVVARPVGRPRPIPGGFDDKFNVVPTGASFHILSPGIGFEMSTITDFNGMIAGSEIRGTARGSNGTIYDFDTDMRFMSGEYIGLDGRKHHGTFGFI